MSKKSDLTVYKDNYLVEASYKLSLMEQRIMLFAISRLDPRNPQDKHSFHVSELLEFYPDLEPSSAYRHLREAVYKLSERWVRTEDPEKVREFRWVESRTYFKDEGRIDIIFTKSIMPYLFQLESQFTKYQLENVASFRGTYSIRIYELLTQYKTLGEREFSVDELKDLLQVADKYPRFNSFNERVLTPALEEINERSDLLISVEPKKRGRKVTALTFKISLKPQKKAVTGRPKFPHKTKYGKYVHLDTQNPKNSSHEYGNYVRDCLKILEEHYAELANVTNEDLRNYWVFLSVNASNKSKFGSKSIFIDELKKRGYKLVECELVKLEK